MIETTTIRVTCAARDVLNDLASKRGESLTGTVSRAVRLLEQDNIGYALAG